MRKLVPCLLSAVLLLAACSSIDCPLNNSVMAVYKFADGTLAPSVQLTVSSPRADGVDTVLVNRIELVDSVSVPMSYAHAEDTLLFDFTVAESEQSVVDTLYVGKTNQPHFESVDCSPAMFHEILTVRHTTNVISSVEIKNKNVTYATNAAHVILHFKNSQP
ncbi:MAG: DUF6452 family protein [Prevotella sp.]